MIGMTRADLFSNCDDGAFFKKFQANPLRGEREEGVRKRLVRLWECKELSDFIYFLP